MSEDAVQKDEPSIKRGSTKCKNCGTVYNNRVIPKYCSSSECGAFLGKLAFWIDVPFNNL